MKHFHEINQKLCELNFAKKSRLELKAISSLYQALDLEDYPKIHVAGTNGKGSCVKKLSAAFTLSGYKCGSFFSPHISSFRERIQIDTKLISQEDVVELIPPLFDLAEKKGYELTFFEIMTLLALQYFAKNKVDIAIFEVGLGGRLDATNCITPILSIITSISLDHVHLLGDTLEKIAKEKAGIIKERVPTLIGPFANQKSIQEIAKEKHSEIIKVEGKFLSYDKENQAIALKAIEHLQKQFSLKEDAIKKALLEKPPCRFEEHVFLGHTLLLDISHNEEGLRRLFNEVNERFINKKKIVFTSMAFNHDYAKNLEIVLKNADEVYLLEIKHPRLAKIQDLLKVCPQAKICQLSEICEIIEKSSKENMFLFTGSIFIMKDIYQLLKKEIEEDPFMIHDGIFKESKN